MSTSDLIVEAIAGLRGDQIHLHQDQLVSRSEPPDPIDSFAAALWNPMDPAKGWRRFCLVDTRANVVSLVWGLDTATPQRTDTIAELLRSVVDRYIVETGRWRRRIVRRPSVQLFFLCAQTNGDKEVHEALRLAWGRIEKHHGPKVADIQVRVSHGERGELGWFRDLLAYHEATWVDENLSMRLPTLATTIDSVKQFLTDRDIQEAREAKNNRDGMGWFKLMSEVQNRTIDLPRDDARDVEATATSVSSALPLRVGLSLSGDARDAKLVVPLAPLTMVAAGNGRGKTTIAELMSDLTMGTPRLRTRFSAQTMEKIRSNTAGRFVDLLVRHESAVVSKSQEDESRVLVMFADDTSLDLGTPGEDSIYRWLAHPRWRDMIDVVRASVSRVFELRTLLGAMTIASVTAEVPRGSTTISLDVMSEFATYYQQHGFGARPRADGVLSEAQKSAADDEDSLEILYGNPPTSMIAVSRSELPHAMEGAWEIFLRGAGARRDPSYVAQWIDLAVRLKLDGRLNAWLLSLSRDLLDQIDGRLHGLSESLAIYCDDSKDKRSETERSLREFFASEISIGRRTQTDWTMNTASLVREHYVRRLGWALRWRRGPLAVVIDEPTLAQDEAESARSMVRFARFLRMVDRVRERSRGVRSYRCERHQVESTSGQVRTRETIGVGESGGVRGSSTLAMLSYRRQAMEAVADIEGVLVDDWMSERLARLLPPGWARTIGIWMEDGVEQAGRRGETSAARSRHPAVSFEDGANYLVVRQADLLCLAVQSARRNELGDCSMFPHWREEAAAAARDLGLVSVADYLSSKPSEGAASPGLSTRERALQLLGWLVEEMLLSPVLAATRVRGWRPVAGVSLLELHETQEPKSTPWSIDAVLLPKSIGPSRVRRVCPNHRVEDVTLGKEFVRRDREPISSGVPDRSGDAVLHQTSAAAAGTDAMTRDGVVHLSPPDQSAPTMPAERIDLTVPPRSIESKVEPTHESSNATSHAPPLVATGPGDTSAASPVDAPATSTVEPVASAAASTPSSPSVVAFPEVQPLVVFQEVPRGVRLALSTYRVPKVTMPPLSAPERCAGQVDRPRWEGIFAPWIKAVRDQLSLETSLPGNEVHFWLNCAPSVAIRTGTLFHQTTRFRVSVNTSPGSLAGSVCVDPDGSIPPIVEVETKRGSDELHLLISAIHDVRDLYRTWVSHHPDLATCVVHLHTEWTNFPVRFQTPAQAVFWAQIARRHVLRCGARLRSQGVDVATTRVFFAGPNALAVALGREFRGMGHIVLMDREVSSSEVPGRYVESFSFHT